MFLKLKHIKTKTLLIAGCSVFLAVCIITGTLALLERRKELEHDIISSNIVVTPHVYFKQDDGEIVDGSEYTDERRNGYFWVDLDPANSDAPNYIDKLMVSIEYKGVTKGYVRVFVGDMWVITEKDAGGNIFRETAIYQEDTEFAMPAEVSWLDNRLYDNFYYYIGDNEDEPGIVSAKNANDYKMEIAFINGLGSEQFHEYTNGRLYLNIRAEAVQFNRIEAFWGMEKPPGVG